MKFLVYLMAIVFAKCLSWTEASKLVCYYDTSSPMREGSAKFTSKDMETALQFCSYIIYSHVIIIPKTFALTQATYQKDKEFLNIVKLKSKYPNVKFLLSISGDEHWNDTEHFLELLEADSKSQQSFVASAVQMLLKYKFDGLSLDIPLPTDKPQRVHTYYAKIWIDFKKIFTRNFARDAKAMEHKKQLTDLIQQLRDELRPHNLMLSLTVLPNVNSKTYFDAPAIVNNLDFVVLSAFDFYTPERNPEEADYVAPINAPVRIGNRLPNANVDYLVQEWVKSLKIPSNKVIVGIPAWGRSWKMSKESGKRGLPPIYYTQGPAPAGPLILTSGFLSWPETCKMLPTNSTNIVNQEDNYLLKSVVDPTNKYGNYAFRAADNNGNHGIWISYEDPPTAAAKAEYVKEYNLGGVALFDISLDDMHGLCGGDTFPILRSIVIKLLQ